MEKMKSVLLTMTVVLGFIIGSSTPSFSSPSVGRTFLTLATATVGGTWYPVGVGMASLWTEKLKDSGIVVSGQSSAGGQENIDMMRKKEIELCFLNSSNAYYAFTGTDMYEGNAFTDMAGMTCLNTNYLHYVILANKVKEGSAADVNGLRYSPGPAGSGGEITFKIVAKALGLEIRRESLGFSASSEAMRNGMLDGASYDATYPVAAVSELYATPGVEVKLLSFTQEQVDKMNDILPNCFTIQDVPANTYSGQTEAIPVAAYRTLLVCSKDLDEELVYNLMTVLYDNVDYMSRVHVSCANMTLDVALDGMNLPLHAGAVKFFKEKGVAIPDSIIP
jgi:TRAP transporter TAXI family solute receptor